MDTSLRNKLTGVVAVAVIALVGWWVFKPKHPAPRAPQRSAQGNDPVIDAPRSAVPAPSPVASATGSAAVRHGPRVVLSATWGSGRNQVGRNVPEEANPEGPMSFGVDRSGNLLVLDQVNGRIMRYDANGNPVREIRLGSMYPQDVATVGNDSLAVLDRLADKDVTILDSNGNVVGKLPLEGQGIPEPGGVTGVFVDGDDVYAEREHASLVKIGTTDGKPAEERDELPGRPSRDGQLFLNAGLVEPATGRIYVAAIDRATRDHRFTRELRLDDAVLHLVLLDSDKLGTIYVAGVVGNPEEDGSGVQVQLVCLEPLHGEPFGGAVMPASILPDETFRDMVVLDDGGVLYAERTEQGMTVRQYRCN
jgi:hypothetical protein